MRAAPIEGPHTITRLSVTVNWSLRRRAATDAAGRDTQMGSLVAWQSTGQWGKAESAREAARPIAVWIAAYCPKSLMHDAGRSRARDCLISLRGAIATWLLRHEMPLLLGAEGVPSQNSRVGTCTHRLRGPGAAALPPLLRQIVPLLAAHLGTATRPAAAARTVDNRQRLGSPRRRTWPKRRDHRSPAPRRRMTAASLASPPQLLLTAPPTAE